MDFVQDQFTGGRKFHVQTAVDKWSRAGVLLDVDLAMNGRRAVDAFERFAR